MWITTSKHADTGLKRAAHALALALPGCSFIRRGEQGLERMQELAEREAEDTILVLSSPEAACRSPVSGSINAPSSAFILRSRQKKEGVWIWQAQEMVVEKMERKTGKKTDENREEQGPAVEEPYKIVAGGEKAKELVQFLGMRDHALAPYYEEGPRIEVEAGAHQDRFSISREDGTITSIQYRWRALCAKK